MRREIEGNRFPIITATYNVLRYKLTTKSNNRQKNGRTIRPRWVPPCPAATTESVDTNARGEDADLRRRPKTLCGASAHSRCWSALQHASPRRRWRRSRRRPSATRATLLLKVVPRIDAVAVASSSETRRPSRSIRSGGRQLLLHISPAGRNHPPILTS